MKMTEKDVNYRISQVKARKFMDLRDYYKNPSKMKQAAYYLCKRNFTSLDDFSWHTSIFGVVSANCDTFTFVGLTTKVLFVATRKYTKLVDLETREITFI